MNSQSTSVKILFITHDASRTGAPILLLHFISALKKRNPTIVTDIIIVRDGPLTAAFAQAGRVLVLGTIKSGRTHIIAEKIKRRLGFDASFFNSLDKQSLLKFIAKQNYQTIFSNTILNGHILDIIKPAKEKVVSYIHELEGLIRSYTTTESRKAIFQYTGRFCVPSQPVAEHLLKNYAVSKAGISLLKYYIPVPESSTTKKNAIRAKLNINNDTLIIGGAGTAEGRKGIDLFIQTALQFKKIYHKPFVFLWVGADSNTLSEQGILQDAEKAGIAGQLIMIEPVNKPADYIALMDIFLLCSREDAYPLVVLEAALLEKPIICFDHSGGAVEFIRGAGNKVVPYLDTAAMANCILELTNMEDRAGLGRQAKKFCQQLHSEEATLPYFEEVLNIRSRD